MGTIATALTVVTVKTLTTTIVTVEMDAMYRGVHAKGWMCALLAMCNSKVQNGRKY